jgi:hypothetical protein
MAARSPNHGAWGPDTMSIFQRLYDSEINFEVSGFYDAGFDVRLGDALNGFLVEGRSRRGTRSKRGCASKLWRISRTVNLRKMSCERHRLISSPMNDEQFRAIRNPTITGIEPEWHVHSIEWDRAHLVEQAL